VPSAATFWNPVLYQTEKTLVPLVVLLTDAHGVQSGQDGASEKRLGRVLIAYGTNCCATDLSGIATKGALKLPLGVGVCGCHRRERRQSPVAHVIARRGKCSDRVKAWQN